MHFNRSHNRAVNAPPKSWVSQEVCDGGGTVHSEFVAVLQRKMRYARPDVNESCWMVLLNSVCFYLILLLEILSILSFFHSIFFKWSHT